MTGNVSALHRLMHSRLNWNLEVLVFEERGNQSSLEKISWRRAENQQQLNWGRGFCLHKGIDLEMFFFCVCVLGRVVLSWTVASMPFILILIFPSSQKFNNSVLLQVFFFSFFLTFLNLKLPLKMFVPDPGRVTSSVKSWSCLIVLIGTLRSDDGDANENVKKTIGLTTETTTLHKHHVFFVHFFAITA